ncbi:Hsp20/alpha crystallin family protein [Massilia sp. PAMC28688]|uniref:Hsp20/alpha crystallin family protein n=1 Tax=Massilia sp. PAMC28688 TaxID=2861283 RepID=UPI001C62BF2A|nr:Hsp20/alpha crystallin family protein [Massilia sp. PAMC28688]QYF95897.1 Hsp20/alpha crystallin family protein [Massilia sp. PAMC28688]
MFRSMFPGDIFAQMDRIQRELQQTLDLEPSIRGVARGSFPALNLGSTPQSIEVYVFMPGLDPASIDVQLEHGVLTIAGERADDLSAQGERATVQINERFAGRFKRVINLPEQIDPEAVNAAYRDGVLHVSVARRQSAQPRQISVH